MPTARACGCGPASPRTPRAWTGERGPSLRTDPRWSRRTGGSRSTPPPLSSCCTTSTPAFSTATWKTAQRPQPTVRGHNGTARGAHTVARPRLEPRHQDRRHPDLPRPGWARHRAALVSGRQKPRLCRTSMAGLERTQAKTELASALLIRQTPDTRRGVHRLGDLHRPAAAHRPGHPRPHTPAPPRRQPTTKQPPSYSRVAPPPATPAASRAR